MLSPADIVVGARARKDVGDLRGLADSIRRLGLLHPIVVNTRRELIAGGRRLAAVKRMGWQVVSVRVVENLDEAADALAAERDENACRLPLKPAEALELGRRLEALERERALERKRAGTNQHTPPAGKLPAGSTGETRDKVASALGMSGRTFAKIKQVGEAAEKDPGQFGDLPAVMDERSVDAAHKELRSRQAERSPDSQISNTTPVAAPAPAVESGPAKSAGESPTPPAGPADPAYPPGLADLVGQLSVLMESLNDGRGFWAAARATPEADRWTAADKLEALSKAMYRRATELRNRP